MLSRDVLIAGGLRLAVIVSWTGLLLTLLGSTRQRLAHQAGWPVSGGGGDKQPWQASLMFMTEHRGLVLPHFFSPDAASSLGTSALHRVSLLTQLSVDRLDSLVSLAAAWQSRLSAAVIVRSVEELATLQRRYAAEPLLRQLASLHLLIGSAEEKYPVNRLRNVALEHERHAEFVLMVDVDFICNPGMAGELNALVARLWDSGDEQRPLCAVVPAFELLPGVAYPRSKEALRRLYYTLAAFQVHYFKGVHAHQPTDYPRWMDAVQGAHYQIAYDYLYEPYVVLRRQQSPRYDEDFIGYGNDKASHAYELQAAGFRFVVAPDSFIIHRDHGEPAWRADQSSSESWDNWWLFVRRIRHKYPAFRQIVPTWLYASCLAGDCPLFWEWEEIL